MRTLRLNIAGVQLEVQAPGRPWLDPLSAQLQGFAGGGGGALRVEVQVQVQDEPSPAFTGALPTIARAPDGGRVLTGEGFVARFDDSSASIEQVDSPAPLAAFLKVLVAAGLEPRGGLLLHAVGLARERAAVLVGPSGAGKSTLGRLGARAGLVLLADELVAVHPASEGFVVQGTPWNVGAPQTRPLAWLGSMSHADGNHLQQAEAGVLLRLLLGNVLVADPSPEGRHRLFRAASALLGRVELRHLAFDISPQAAQLVRATLEPGST